jgi:hypothetical protein
MVSRVRLRYRARTYSLRASHLVRSWVFRRQFGGEATADAASVAADLDTEGVHVTSLDRLLPESAPQILANAAALLQDEGARTESALWTRGSASSDLAAEAMLARVPELYLLGLDARILQLVQHYLRLPVAYHGAVLRHSLIDGRFAGPRLWHQDAEDFHVFRMVLYLTDVTATSGPFEYIPRSLGITYRHFHDHEGELTNERMEQVVPKRLWGRCLGPAGTVVMCDTAKVFHHESMQTERDRAVLMIGYSSRRPSGMDLAMSHFPVERVTPALRKIVPPANHGHVFEWRRSPEHVPTPPLVQSAT